MTDDDDFPVVPSLKPQRPWHGRVGRQMSGATQPADLHGPGTTPPDDNDDETDTPRRVEAVQMPNRPGRR